MEAQRVSRDDRLKRVFGIGQRRQAEKSGSEHDGDSNASGKRKQEAKNVLTSISSTGGAGRSPSPDFGVGCVRRFGTGACRARQFWRGCRHWVLGNSLC